MAAFDITAPTAALSLTGFDGNNSFTEQLTDTRFIVSQDVYVQIMSLNKTTGVITPLETPFGGTGNASTNSSRSVVRLDDTHFVIFYMDGDADGWVKSFSVDESTGEIANWGSAVEYDTAGGRSPSSVLMANDGTNARILTTWGRDNDDGVSAIFTVSMSTGTITEGANFVYDTTDGRFPTVAKLSDTKAVVCYRGTGSMARVLDINTSTWVVSGANSAYEWNATSNSDSSVALLSTSPLSAVNTASISTTTYLRPLSIDDSTWAVSNLGSLTALAAAFNQLNARRISRIDDTHFIVFTSGAGSDGFVYTYELDTGTGGLTQLDGLEFDTSNATAISMCDMGDGVFVACWAASSSELKGRAFIVEPAPTFTASPLIHQMAVAGGLM